MCNIAYVIATFHRNTFERMSTSLICRLRERAEFSKRRLIAISSKLGFSIRGFDKLGSIKRSLLKQASLNRIPPVRKDLCLRRRRSTAILNLPFKNI
ncbi:unnamed protein product [Ixodes persulcatus]